VQTLALVVATFGRAGACPAMESFQIPNLNCGHCVRAVTEAVHTADPAATVQCDLATKAVQVDSSMPRKALVAQLIEAGYAPA
jgi:copper chaperone